MDRRQMMDFTSIESDAYTAQFVECQTLGQLIRAAWKTPELEELWTFSKTEEGRLEIGARMDHAPYLSVAPVLYVYVVDIRFAGFGPSMLGKIAKDNRFAFSIYDRVVRKTM